MQICGLKVTMQWYDWWTQSLRKSLLCMHLFMQQGDMINVDSKFTYKLIMYALYSCK